VFQPPPSHSKLARRGILAGVNSPAVVGGADPRALSNRSTPRVELIDKLPPLLTFSGGADFFEAQYNSPPITLAPCYKLLDIRPDKLGFELFVNSLTVEQLPCDVAGTASTSAADQIPWGDRWGRGAAIVATKDIQSADSSGWFDLPLFNPTLNTSKGTWDTAPLSFAEPSAANPSTMLWRCGFPAGTLADTAVFNRVLTKGFGALGVRLGFGSVFNVWLVLHPEYFPNGTTIADGTFYGHVDVQAHCAPTYSPGGFSETAA